MGNLLLNYWHGVLTGADVTVEELVERTGLNERVVRQAVEELQDKGYLVPGSRHGSYRSVRRAKVLALHFIIGALYSFIIAELVHYLASYLHLSTWMRWVLVVAVVVAMFSLISWRPGGRASALDQCVCWIVRRI